MASSSSGWTPSPLYDEQAGEGVFIIGCAQPDWEPARDAAFDGTMMTPLEAIYQAHHMSFGPHLADVPLVLEHAGKRPGDDGTKLDASQRIGSVAEAWYEPGEGLMVAGFVPATRPEAELIARGDKKFGLSFFTNYTKRGPELLAPVDTLRMAHLGVTDNPAWQREGTWLTHVTRDPVEARRVLRERTAGKQGIVVPEPMARRLRQTETADRYVMEQRVAERARAAAAKLHTHLHRFSSTTMASATDSTAPVTTGGTGQQETAAAASAAAAAELPKVIPLDAAARLTAYKAELLELEKRANPSDRLFYLRDILASMNDDVAQGRVSPAALLETDWVDTYKKARDKSEAVLGSLESYVDTQPNVYSEATRARLKNMWRMTPKMFGDKGAQEQLRIECASVGASFMQQERSQRDLEFLRLEKKKEEEQRKALEDKQKALEDQMNTAKRLADDLAKERDEQKKKYEALLAERSAARPTSEILSQLRDTQAETHAAARHQTEAQLAASAAAAAATATANSSSSSSSVGASASGGDAYFEQLARRFQDSHAQFLQMQGKGSEPLMSFEGKLPQPGSSAGGLRQNGDRFLWAGQ